MKPWHDAWNTFSPPGRRKARSILRHVSALLSVLLLTFGAYAGNAERTAAKLAKEAPRTLRTVRMFTIGGVGESGSPAQAEFSFRALLKRPDAVAECQGLVAEATPAGQLYGLLGLRLLDAQAFQTALPRYRGSNIPVPTMTGCILHSTTAGAVAAGIERGKIR